jgi:hypothetical protein
MQLVHLLGGMNSLVHQFGEWDDHLVRGDTNAPWVIGSLESCLKPAPDKVD